MQRNGSLDSLIFTNNDDTQYVKTPKTTTKCVHQVHTTHICLAFTHITQQESEMLVNANIYEPPTER